MNRTSQSIGWTCEAAKRGYLARESVNASAHLPFGCDPRASSPGH